MVRNIRFVMWHAIDSLPRTDGTGAALGARPGEIFAVNIRQNPLQNCHSRSMARHIL